MNRAQRRAVEREAKPTSNAVPDAIHRECDRLIKAVERLFDGALQRSPSEAMYHIAVIARGYCIVVMPIPRGEKPANNTERILNARSNVVALDMVIADFKSRGDDNTVRTLEKIGREKVPVVAYVPVHETLTQCAVGCIECRVLSPGGSA